MYKFIAGGLVTALLLSGPGHTIRDQGSPSWKLSNLRISLEGDSSAVIDGGGYGAVPVLRVKIFSGNQVSAEVFLEQKRDRNDYDKASDGYFTEKVSGVKNRSKLVFKSDAMLRTLRKSSGTVTIEVQEVSATKRDGGWQVKGYLTNAQTTSIAVTGKK
jgi:hypothetical protein